MAGTLDGVRVIDFGQYIAGPVTAVLLADHGAEVIRVDPSGGPRWETPANAAWNRGKRSIALDLKAADDREIARRLIASADVVVENFRPGVMDRLGVGPATMLDVNPRLIYCSMPGFASDDPRASLPAWEGVVMAAAAGYRPPRGSDRPPLYNALPLASMFAAFNSAVAIAAALFSRERDGRGQRIETPLFDSMFTAIGANGLLVNGAPSGDRPSDYGGGIFECSDGRWVQVALAKPHFMQHLVQAAGVAARFDPAQLRVDAELRRALMSALPEIFATRPADEWEELCAEADLPLVKVRSVDEWLGNEHARASEAVIPIDDPQYGTMWQANSPVRLSTSDFRPSTPAPRLDADRSAILRALEERPPVTPGVNGTPRRAALEGVRVVDVSLVLAGPVCARTLAEYGAEVVKINPPREEGSGPALSIHRYHTDVNRGKRSVLVDLKQPGGVELFWRLVADADVVTHNFRPSVLERLGIGYEVARERRPGIIYSRISSYGDRGPWRMRPAYEPLAQAATGMSERQGGEGRPLGQAYAVNDYGTGLMSAFGTLLALYHRERTGEGQEAEAALTYTGTALQFPFMLSVGGHRRQEPRGPEARGPHALQRLYEAGDGWFFVGARRSDLAKLATIDGLERLDALEGAELEAELERRFAALPAGTWCERLAAAGIGAHRLTGVAELMKDSWVVERGLSVTRRHDTGDEITTIGPAPRLSATPLTPGRPAPTLGIDARTLLRDIGLGEDLDRLAGAVVVPSTAPVE